MKSLAINVKAEDIIGATRADPCECPIARAIRRQLLNPYRKIFSFVTSDGERLEYTRPFNMVLNVSIAEKASLPLTYGRIDLPQSAQDFIEAYDTRRPVKPFTFTLEVSDATALLFRQPLTLPARAGMART